MMIRIKQNQTSIPKDFIPLAQQLISQSQLRLQGSELHTTDGVLDLRALPGELATSDGVLAALLLLLRRRGVIELHLEETLAEEAHSKLQQVESLLEASGPLIVGLEEELSAATRRRYNRLAEEMLMLADTPARRHHLGRYSGWGGIGGSLNEYYTRPSLAQAMWELVLQVSKPQTILEPSCGTGVFLQYAPDAALSGVEIHPTSAKIAQRLFPHATIHHQPFESFHAQHLDKRYDCIIGNPPFGLRGYTQDGEKEYARYFLKMALHHCQIGGIIALVLPAGILRNQSDQAIRAQVQNSAKVLAVFGLPNSAFFHAHTEAATTDVWFLQRSNHPCLDQAFLEGNYHQANPHLLLGIDEKAIFNSRKGDYAQALAQMKATSLAAAMQDGSLEATSDQPEPTPPSHSIPRYTLRSTPHTLEVFDRGWKDLSHLKDAYQEALTIGQELLLYQQTRLVDADAHQRVRLHLLKRLDHYLQRFGDPHSTLQPLGERTELQQIKAALKDGVPHLEEGRNLGAYNPMDLHSVMQMLKRNGLKSDLANIARYLAE